MTIDEIKTIVEDYTLSDFTSIEITLELFTQDIMPYPYNSLIRRKIKKSIEVKY